jgi:hypothetical protein
MGQGISGAIGREWAFEMTQDKCKCMARHYGECACGRFVDPRHEQELRDAWEEGLMSSEECQQIGLAAALEEYGPNPYGGDQ